ncbi:hypothetical protein LY78DRAFT_717345, partial [Colletotrichum sublineola]
MVHVPTNRVYSSGIIASTAQQLGWRDMFKSLYEIIVACWAEGVNEVCRGPVVYPGRNTFWVVRQAVQFFVEGQLVPLIVAFKVGSLVMDAEEVDVDVRGPPERRKRFAIHDQHLIRFLYKILTDGCENIVAVNRPSVIVNLVHRLLPLNQ